MRKLSLLLLLSLGISQIQAQEEAPFTYHMGVHFGENYADDNSKMRDNALYGIRATVMMTPFYGIGIGYDRLESIDIKDSPKTVDAQRYYMQIEVDGEEQYHTVPYITFGIGYEDLSHDVIVVEKGEEQKYDVSQVYLTGGLGFRYNFIPELSIYAEANALYKTDTTDVDYTILAGLQYHLNATTCDKTYITDRIHEKPQERTVLHAGAVNTHSGWNRGVVATKTAATTEQVRKNVEKPVKRTKAKSVTAKRTKVVTKKPKVKKRFYKESKVGGYYVVLGAFHTEEGLQSFLKKLERKNISYILRDSKKKKLTYVMTGAYASSADAKKALRKMKSIVSDAYIAKMK
jgi:cell division septation protein DedD